MVMLKMLVEIIIMEKFKEIPNSNNVESSMDNSVPEVNIVIDVHGTV